MVALNLPAVNSDVGDLEVSLQRARPQARREGLLDGLRHDVDQVLAGDRDVGDLVVGHGLASSSPTVRPAASSSASWLGMMPAPLRSCTTGPCSPMSRSWAKLRVGSRLNPLAVISVLRLHRAHL